MTVEHEGISWDIKNDRFSVSADIFDFARYLKTRYGNIERCKSRFLNFFYEAAIGYGFKYRVHSLDQLAHYVKVSPPFSYEEAFRIENDAFRALVFGSINVPEMISFLGTERINVEGKDVRHRKYKEDGSYTMEDYHVIYELHRVNGEKLGIDDVYAVKCWCTTTNKEYWLWVEEEYADKGALEAIASTFRVYENMSPYIKTIKRQGDVCLYEMTKEVKPAGNIVPLTAEQYFSKLVAQS